MARPVSYNLIKKPLESDISMAEMPKARGRRFFCHQIQ